MTGKGLDKLTLPLAHYSVLASTIPALVHRANNCLLVIDGTLALVEGLDPEGRETALEQVEMLKDLLGHLAFQSRVEIEEVGEFEVGQLLSEVEFVLGIIGRFRRCEVELRSEVLSASILGDRARVYRLLVSLASERVMAMYRARFPTEQSDEGEGSTLRLSFRVRRGNARFVITDSGGSVPSSPEVRDSLASEAEALGEIWDFRLRGRVLNQASSIVLEAPAHAVTPQPSPLSRRKLERILLVQERGEDAELFVTLLAEKGYRVEHSPALEDARIAESFDLVLCDDELLPSLPPVLPRVLVLGKPLEGIHTFDAIAKPVKPQELLDRVSCALS